MPAVVPLLLSSFFILFFSTWAILGQVIKAYFTWRAAKGEMEASGRAHEEEVQCWLHAWFCSSCSACEVRGLQEVETFPPQWGSLFLPSLPHQRQGLSCLKEWPTLEQKGIRRISTSRVEREKAGFRGCRENYVFKLKTFLGSLSVPEFTSQGSSCLSQGVSLSSPRAGR